MNFLIPKDAVKNNHLLFRHPLQKRVVETCAPGKCDIMNTIPASTKDSEWKRDLSSLQREIFQETWQSFLTTGKWALLRPIYREHGKSLVHKKLSPLAGLAWEEEDRQAGSRLKLRLPGVMLTNDGQQYLSLIGKYFGFQYDLFKTEPEMRQIKSDEIEAKLQLSKIETKILGHLIELGASIGGYAPDFSSWSVQSMSEVEDFVPGQDLGLPIAKWIAKSYYPDNAVFAEERMQKQVLASSMVAINWPSSFPLANKSGIHQLEGNPFQRRYQVFVSSTYLDLVEERKHVMQALLETKCIPSGMELFPAASMEQMKLIQGVIDDCDYYLVIVAGKYGSCSPSGTSYTEMEFDYAISAGKPILAFYHNDIKKLPGEKLEDSDEARRKLAAFTAKIKHQRLCRHWTTADGLASAIKTAIFHAIETNPKPGWVRADTVPTWNMVHTLEERIADLEGGVKAETARDFPDGTDQMEIKTKVSWDEQGTTRWNNTHHRLDKVFALNWDELFLHVAPEPGITTSRLGLLKSFGFSLAKEIESELQARATSRIIRMAGNVDGDLFNQILQTFLAQKLLKNVSPPKKVRTKMPYWTLAPKGMQKLAELRAIKSKGNPASKQ